MSLLNVKSCAQNVVLGLAILAAVLAAVLVAVLTAALVDRLGHRS